MSYCTFSSQGEGSDVMVEVGDGCWTVTVATRRRKVIGRACPILGLKSFLNLKTTYKELIYWMERGEGKEWEWEDIDYEYAGCTFTFFLPEKFLSFLLLLKSKGIRVPAFIIRELEIETSEERG